MFNVEKFLSASFEYRTQTVETPQLKSFFGDEKPEFLVKGLSGEQIALVNDAQSRTGSIEVLLQALAKSNLSAKADAIRDSLGIGEDVPSDISRRVEVLIHGAVEPACNRDLAVKIATFFPTVLYDLTNKILILSGEGAQEPGKL